jgi:hypothetical protein
MYDKVEQVISRGIELGSALLRGFERGGLLVLRELGSACCQRYTTIHNSGTGLDYPQRRVSSYM